jgi:hypothetical protein
LRAIIARYPKVGGSLGGRPMRVNALAINTFVAIVAGIIAIVFAFGISGGGDISTLLLVIGIALVGLGVVGIVTLARRGRSS